MDDRIQKTIERLKSLSLDGGSHENLSAICDVLYGGKPEFGWTMGACEGLREALIGMLGEYDPEDWADEYLAEVGIVRLPKDAEGETIHVGDTIRLNDTTPRVFSLALYDDGWRVGFVGEHGHYSCLPKDDTHYHKPTVEEILDELGGLRGTGDYEAVVTRAAELAEQLRELIGNDQLVDND